MVVISMEILIKPIMSLRDNVVVPFVVTERFMIGIKDNAVTVEVRSQYRIKKHIPQMLL